MGFIVLCWGVTDEHLFGGFVHLLYLCNMKKVVAIEPGGGGCVLYGTLTDAAFASGMGRLAFYRRMVRDGCVEAGGYRYVYPEEA